MTMFIPKFVFDRAFRRAFITVRRCCTAIVLLAIQVYPLEAQQTERGRLDVGLGISADSYQQQLFSRTHYDLLKKRAVKSFTVSGTVDFVVNETVRLSGFAGHSRVSVGNCLGQAIPSCPFSDPFSGVFAGAEVDFQNRFGAIGFGAAVIPIDDKIGDTTSRLVHRGFPISHLLIGNRQHKHFRGDFMKVMVPGQVPSLTLGMGVGDPDGKTERAFIGVGSMLNGGTPGLAGRVAILMQKRGTVVLGGLVGFGAYSFSAGARLNSFPGRS